MMRFCCGAFIEEAASTYLNLIFQKSQVACVSSAYQDLCHLGFLLVELEKENQVVTSAVP